ncbi:hypothetical protein Y032_0205g1909 [Ancylostoma ceylanicum]|uniref:Uncharacterized protein n=1 Tax=Ancylostoma ceylanicum TaxID=53326 RepID=A0A016SLF3_9BILA|nr:hypothetical protein Y032_0205g1909 [Ancylostoma ceylanicum]
MIVKGLLLIYLPKKGEDQQVFIQNLRSFLLAAVGLFVLLFRHPGLLGLTTLQCNIWFIISTTCYSLGCSRIPSRDECMDRIRRSAFGYKTTPVRRKSDDVADSAVDNAFEYFHAV